MLCTLHLPRSAQHQRAVEWLQGVLEKRYTAVRATGVSTETDGGGRGVALRIECHRCQVIRTGRLDASVTADGGPVATGQAPPEELPVTEPQSTPQPQQGNNLFDLLNE